MTTIVPRSEIIHRAIRWISDERTARPDLPIRRIVDEAEVRFDLSPSEGEWLRQTLVAEAPHP